MTPPPETYRHVSESVFWKAEPIWQGAVAVVIGGGPSLAGLDWAPLADSGKKILGVNDSIFLGDWVDAGLYGDGTWHDAWKNKLRKFNRTLVSITAERPPQSVRWMLRETEAVPSPKENHKLWWSGNTGMSAIHLACLLGARKVILLGFDMRTVTLADGRTIANWYDNHLDSPKPELYRKWLERESVLACGLKHAFPKTEIVNASPISRMTMFPKVKLENAI